MLYTLKMTLSGSESLPGHCPWTPSRWRCASLASLTPLAIIIHNYFPPLRLGLLQPCQRVYKPSILYSLTHTHPEDDKLVQTYPNVEHEWAIFRATITLSKKNMW